MLPVISSTVPAIVGFKVPVVVVSEGKVIVAVVVVCLVVEAVVIVDAVRVEVLVGVDTFVSVGVVVSAVVVVVVEVVGGNEQPTMANVIKNVIETVRSIF